jgi:hypothetical protein
MGKQKRRMQRVKAGINRTRRQVKIHAALMMVHATGAAVKRRRAYRVAPAGPKTPRCVARKRDSGRTGRVHLQMLLEMRGFVPLM